MGRDREAPGRSPAAPGRGGDGCPWPRASSSRGRAGREPVLITEASPAMAEQHAARKKRYAITMGIRVVCLVLAAVFYQIVWLMLIFAVLGTVLPWIAVVMANDGPPKKRCDPNRYTHRPDRSWRPAPGARHRRLSLSGPPAAGRLRPRAPARRPAPRPGRRPRAGARPTSSPAANASPAPVVSTTVVGCAGRCTRTSPAAHSAPSAPSFTATTGYPRGQRPCGLLGVPAPGEQPGLVGVGQQQRRAAPCRPATGPPRTRASGPVDAGSTETVHPAATAARSACRPASRGRGSSSVYPDRCRCPPAEGTGTSPASSARLAPRSARHAPLPARLDQAHDRAGRRRRAPCAAPAARRRRSARRPAPPPDGSSPTQPASATDMPSRARCAATLAAAPPPRVLMAAGRSEPGAGSPGEDDDDVGRDVADDDDGRGHRGERGQRRRRSAPASSALRRTSRDVDRQASRPRWPGAGGRARTA